ncbi:MAG TPA: hypothetical protein VI911_08775 [Patescibacteria group bacterium]|nr:MAG: hypothetical protein UR43_C0005G0077 [candidate division TM6 bacterium GW2011_GWF2_33_332]HLD91090.1 hypothetical protein [Patescibacteria group bacterium]
MNKLDLEPIEDTKLDLEPIEDDNFDLESKSNEEISQTESAIRGGVQGLTLGFGDELIGAGKAVGSTLFGQDELSNFMDTYRRERDTERAKMEAAQEANPIIFTASEIGSGIAPAFFTGGATAAATLGKLGLKEAVKQSAATGAKYGAAAGLGYGEADLTQAEVPKAVQEIGMGSLTGGALGAGMGYIGQKAIKPGMEKLNSLREYIREKSTSSFRKMFEAGELAKEGEEIIGQKIQQTIMDDLSSKATEIQKNLENVKREGVKKFDDLWQKTEAEQMKKDYTTYIDNLSNEFKLEHQNALTDDTAKKAGKVLEQLNNIKKKFITKEDVIVPDYTAKETALGALEKKKVLMELADSEGEGASKEIAKMLDKYALIEGDIQPAKIDTIKVSKLLNISGEEATDILKDVVRLKYKQKELIPELGVEMSLPKEMKAVAKTFEPGEIIVDDLKGLAYFKDARGRVNSVYWGKIPTKVETREIQNAINLKPKEMKEFSDSLKLIAGKDKGTIESRVRELAKGVRKDFDSLLGEKGMLDEFSKVMKSYESMYGATKKLKKKDLISEDVVTKDNAIDDLTDMLKNIKLETAAGEKAQRKFEKFMKYYRDIVGQEKADELYTAVNKLSQLYDINQSAANSGLQVSKAFIGGVEAAGIRGAIGLGKVSKGIEKASDWTGKMVKEIVNTLPNNLAKLADKAENPKIAQLFRNLAATENEQSRRALLFSAMQNPNTKDLLLKTFGVDLEKKEP